ncbi:hypothetical protein ANN_09014 [Periplaneta americana]|uniref:Uncharacterized protein n=1 Tax=Periplaneta americana TaxID=6978 RepID=A0ABQ8TK76_PERAM|nr:hypothetical protein ANN_09014 [Periplaneta americana]
MVLQCLASRRYGRGTNPQSLVKEHLGLVENLTCYDNSVQTQKVSRIMATSVYDSKSYSADYHDEMNSENYNKWLKERLLPNLPSECIVVLDNAKPPKKTG